MNWGDTGFTTYAQQQGAKPVAGDFNGDCYWDIALTGGTAWNTMPIAFSNGDGTFHGTNAGETSGDPFFAVDARSGAQPSSGDFDGDGIADIALAGTAGWRTMPIAFSNGDGTYHGSNAGETSGDGQFPSEASFANSKLVCW